MAAIELERYPASLGKGHGLFAGRRAQPLKARLPEGTVLVSADGHIPITDDLWVERFPAHLRDRAPRVWWDELNQIFHFGFKTADGMKSMFPPSAFPLIKSMEDHDGCRNLSSRISDMDAEGIRKEVVFPQVLPIFFPLPDLDVREWIFRAYNQHLATLQAKQPERLFPVGVATWWDPAKGIESIREIKALGLKTFMIPMNPGKMSNGRNVVYSNPEFAPFWQAAEDSGLPVCFHVGERLDYEGPNGFGALSLWEFGGHFRKNFGELVFGGIFDRHPDLKIVFAEAGISWVPPMLQDAEKIYDSIGKLFEFLPVHRPTHYWHKHCHASFITDSAGLALIDRIGVDTAMWSSDYPHNEGTFGYTQDAIQEVIDAVAPNDARKILGGNAIRVFKL